MIIYYYKIDDSLEILDYSFFSNVRKEKLKRITDSNKRRLSINLELLLQYAFSDFKKKIPYEYYYNENGKPICDDVCFSLSDSMDMVAVAMSSNSVGIDIERKDRDITRIKNKVLSIKEIDKAKDNYYLINKFVSKESYLKLIGKGIFDCSVSSITINELNVYQKTFDIDDYVVVATAFKKEDINIKEIKKENIIEFLKGIKDEKI